MHTDRLDPYGCLEFVIGSGDDFVCFDYSVDTSARTVRFASVVNSETGHFIQNFEDECTVPFAEAVAEAQRLVNAALDWCGENEVEHDAEGRNQDPQYLVRAVTNAISNHPVYPVVRRIDQEITHD